MHSGLDCARAPPGCTCDAMAHHTRVVCVLALFSRASLLTGTPPGARRHPSGAAARWRAPERGPPPWSVRRLSGAAPASCPGGGGGSYVRAQGRHYVIERWCSGRPSGRRLPRLLLLLLLSSSCRQLVCATPMRRRRRGRDGGLSRVCVVEPRGAWAGDPRSARSGAILAGSEKRARGRDRAVIRARTSNLRAHAKRALLARLRR